ncbi:MAG: hypothetical protein CMJ18_06900, partial [Phycisphaeraceae bacterium]|nr:hypothetical protein [Phycisphaeraceae bacterium]
MGSGPSTTEKLRGLPWALANSACNIVFCYLGILGSVFMLFLDEAGLDKRQIGFLLALFPFSGTIALVIGPLIERAGVKRTFLLFWTLRKLVMALLIATPWVMGRYGATGAFHYVTAIVAAFALCRAVAETAWYPWVQEYVPDSIRGRFTATSSVVSTVAGLLSMGVATLVLRGSGGLSRFTWLFVVAAVFGLVSAVVASKIPGGAPVPRMSARTLDLGSVFRPFADRRFRLYLFGLAVALLGVTPLIVYLPLFMKEVCGLSAGQVVMLDGSIMLAAALVSVPWGWAADRFGSRPIMLLGLVSLMVFGLGLALLPRDSGAALGGAVALVFIYGMCSTAWVIGSGRILYNSIIPAERRTAYTSVYYAWIGVFGGISPLASGWLIERTREAGLSWGGAEIHAYAPVIIMFLVSVPVATWIMSRIRVEGEVPATTFAAMLVRGSPIGAMHSLISYSFASDEKTRVSTVERLGQAKSPLNVEELVESLDDLSFNVRYETIISIARTRPHARLTEALIAVLDGDEPDLSIAAAWALGRIGDPRAIAPLRRQLTSGYPLLAARSGRALAQLGDRESEPLLLARLREELDDTLSLLENQILDAMHVIKMLLLPTAEADPENVVYKEEDESK